MKGQTKAAKKKEIEVKWHLIDVQGLMLGRVASGIAKILTGKHKTNFSFNQNCGDKVVAINVSKIALSGGKEKKKIYFRHTGFMGGLKKESYEKLTLKKPEEALRKAVKGMLPVNKLRKERLNNLYLYRSDKHPHTNIISK
ncbi:50S ribosomal protein L13 [candidate division WWE3 bacterium CG09_land_8_20_14_0_10_39_24]|uniref:Large ribosomal subunit protein uL13 n=2 Tax=Katanobacteria TaxID=422282 RepID=A0A2G9XCV5_UNCKA|nr:MAG: 50S ribosomal protein L13 [bacterium CG2_30_40_12]PIP04767.1 MAG: 50S ribosomal protein L13 [candidate division WWE3 bacterium CG23_combo_of_CG06-09_8_20_14_all_40_14]PIS12794.1 MAG: 50S ribosomal protein L13 [candidate division WWE3 bacterium CG09_land_8_20_14_0_10_39_24]PJE50813.1 MAG: 50S ribosomal protein L13 [candidate division WWE3 bacterium CG10_big_fil_rev_8_21_14_0_10_39_14]